jgi:hypothetical protein
MHKVTFGEIKPTDNFDNHESELATKQSVTWDNIVELDPHFLLAEMIQAILLYMNCHPESKLSGLVQRMHSSGLNTCLLT